MGLLFDSFWRAVAYCVHPRVMALSVLPLLLMAGLAAALHYFYWDSAVEFVRTTLQTTPWLDSVWQWLRGWGVNTDVPTLVAPLLLIVALTPIVVMLALLVIGFLMTPALVNLVATRRFASLERKKGGSFFLSLGWMLGSTALALVALLLSVPLWLIPPLVLLLPPLIWGWLTYRVMAFDALAEHADKHERRILLERHRWSLLLIGIISGSWVSGRMAGRVAPKRQIRDGFLVMVLVSIVNIAANALLPAHVSWSMWPVMFYSFGWALMVPAVTLLVLDLHPERRGMASSLQSVVGSAANGIVAGVLAPMVMHSALGLAIAAAGLLCTGLFSWMWLHKRWPDVGRSAHEVM